jgi:sugar transferase (PEP-CTERM/EpsH1 system associated)
MGTVLYLAHRLPFPPDKGDKVRTHHLLRHLAQRHRVLLGTFYDDPADARHVPQLRQWCADALALPLTPGQKHRRALAALARGEALTTACYRDPAMQPWLSKLAQREQIDAVLVSSSAMAPYALAQPWPLLMDFIDVDSAKWAAYAEQTRGPMRWLYRREHRLLAAFEQQVAQQARCSFFVTPLEMALFQVQAQRQTTLDGVRPAAALQVLGNGVDTDYFSPDPARASPYDTDEWPLVFTGTMDYLPNVDAVLWFCQQVLPALRRQWPQLRLSIVGRNPVRQVRQLAGAAVRVTGEVPDVRPWLQHARAAVAPLRIARGMPNKVLEAMAMACPVVVSPACAQALLAPAAQVARVAHGADDYPRVLQPWLASPNLGREQGALLRQHVQQLYRWDRCLAALDQALELA